MENMKKTRFKYTKNKQLRQLVRNHEIELQRPKGVKFIDMLLKHTPSYKFSYSIFVAKNIQKELNGLTRYRGFNVIGVNGLAKSTGLLADLNNFFYNNEHPF